MRKTTSMAAAAGSFAVAAALSVVTAGLTGTAITTASAAPGANSGASATARMHPASPGPPAPAAAAGTASTVTQVTVRPAAECAANLTVTPAIAGCGTTTVTFAVNTGPLSITVPDTASLSAAAPGEMASGALGAVTVTDARAALDAFWTASVSSSDFTTGGATGAETIPAADVGYWSGPAIATTGAGTFVPGQPTSGAVVSLAATQTAFSMTAGVGDNSATWDPTADVQVPAGAVSGTYTGTITHSVA
ncbi:MAG TPA: hypothetical protein VKD26_10205 [Streptosporangiaceae bacterium]|nr:hypothetical protein [Streptosporangiaceae bacterium]